MSRYQVASAETSRSPQLGGVGDFEAWSPKRDASRAYHLLPGSASASGSQGKPRSLVPRANRGSGGGEFHSSSVERAADANVKLFPSVTADGSRTVGDVGIIDELESLGSIHYSLSKLYEEMNGQDFDRFIAEIESFEMPVDRFRPWLNNESVKKALKDSTQQTTPRPGYVPSPSVAGAGDQGIKGRVPSSRTVTSTGEATASAGEAMTGSGPGSSWEAFASRHKPRLHGGLPSGATSDMQTLLEEESHMLAPVRSGAIDPGTSGQEYNCATAIFISRQYEEINRKDLLIEELETRNRLLANFYQANQAAIRANHMHIERGLREQCNLLETNQEESRSIAIDGIVNIEAASRTKMEQLHREVFEDLSYELVRMQVVTKATHDTSRLSWVEMLEERARHNLTIDADRGLHYLFSDHFTQLHNFMLNLRHHNARPQNYYEGVNPYTIADPRDPTVGAIEANGASSSRRVSNPATPRGGRGSVAQHLLRLEGRQGDNINNDPKSGRGSAPGSARLRPADGQLHSPRSPMADLPKKEDYIESLLNRGVATRQQEMLEVAEGDSKEHLKADADERSRKRDEVRKRQAAAEEAAMKRKEAAARRKEDAHRREHDISLALGNNNGGSKPTGTKAAGHKNSLKSVLGSTVASQDGSSSLDGSYSNVPLAAITAKRAAAAKRTPAQILQEADEAADEAPQQRQLEGVTPRAAAILETARRRETQQQATSAGGGGAGGVVGGVSAAARSTLGTVDTDYEPWAQSVGRKALADLAQFPPCWGWLYKSQGVLMSWQQRYFVFTQTGKLKYTTQDPTVEGANVRWILLLHAEDITRVEVDMFHDSTSGVRPPVDQYHSNCFYIDAVSNHDDHEQRGRPRRFKFCCRNKSEMTRWMQTLRKATDVVYSLEEASLVPRSPVREHFRRMFALLSPLLATASSGLGDEEIPAYRRRVQMEDDIAALEAQQREAEEKERREEEEERRLGQMSPRKQRGRSASPPPTSKASTSS